MAKRRANGEGTITKRSDGRYHAAAYVFRPDGTRVRKFVYGRTREEVAGKLTEIQEKTRQGIPAATSAMAFGEYLTYWLATIAPTRLKPATLNSYEGLTRLYIRPALAKKNSTAFHPPTSGFFSRSSRTAACAVCAGWIKRAHRKNGTAARWAAAASAGRPPGPSSTYTPCCGPRCNRRSGKN